MIVLKTVFFLGIFIIIYSYVGYGLLVWFILKIRNIFFKRIAPSYPKDLPSVTLVIAAYNESGYIVEKLENTLQLDYPEDKFNIILITDGSTDNTPQLAAQFARVKVLHENERRGKIQAIHRAMAYVTTPIVIFSDANTLLNNESIRNIARHYSSSNVGGVAGEKKIQMMENGKVAGAGEGLYWKYESWLKQKDSELYTVVGAAGELFSIRTELYEYVGNNILLDDFIISLKVCMKGFRVVYEPEAFASEAPSASMVEEQKRKIRISAGAFQSIVMLKSLLNVFRYGLLSFQYISHRVLRWTLCPLFLPIIFIINLILISHDNGPLYWTILIFQLVFYIAALAGWMFSRNNIKVKALYVPYYFLFLNISLYLGLFRYLKGSQTVLWDKAAREKYV